MCNESSPVEDRRTAICERCEFTEMERYPSLTQETASMNPEHDGQRGIGFNTRRPEYVERETVL
jgi:hypothetical protein